MPEVSVYAPGAFCWVELATTNAAAAKEFYAAIFGWELEETGTSAGTGAYTMIRRGGKDVGGLCVLSEELRSQGVPPHWLSYITVEDADDTANRAESLGAEIKMGPADVMDVGRMAVIQDPTGAVFAVWQPKKHHGAGVVNDPGAVCWYELATPDRAAAKRFYRELFGYRLADEPMGSGIYTLLLRGDVREAGMTDLPSGVGDVPPHWMVYFAVEDCDGTVRAVESRGGRVLVPATDVPGIGRFATLADPQGAAFSVIRLREAS